MAILATPTQLRRSLVSSATSNSPPDRVVCLPITQELTLTIDLGALDNHALVGFAADMADLDFFVKCAAAAVESELQHRELD